MAVVFLALRMLRRSNGGAVIPAAASPGPAYGMGGMYPAGLLVAA
jgi:hypothetical protein